MNLLVQWGAPQSHPPTTLREEYLDGLRFAQDALLEVIVRQSQFVPIHWKEQVIGYFALTQEGGISEFHLQPQFKPHAHTLYRRFVREKSIPSALVKSFDDIAFSCALDINESVRVRGMLVREYEERPLPHLSHLLCEMCRAEDADLPEILAIEQDVFTHPARLKAVITQGQLLLFRKNSTLVGFGLIRPIIPERPEVEIGIAVDVPYRNKGYAAFILRDLVNEALKKGFIPVSGCAKENEASIRLGLRIGFRSSHRLLEIKF